jgi:hypothetical protein
MSKSGFSEKRKEGKGMKVKELTNEYPPNARLRGVSLFIDKLQHESGYQKFICECGN